MQKITRRMVKDYLATFEWFREPAKQGYLATAIDRFTHTLNLIPRLPNPEQVKVLEIGGMPYFMTVLIEKFFGYDVQVANEPTYEYGGEKNHQVLANDHGETYDIRYKTMNIEYDPWPYEDNSFDLVIYCEVIEHLVYDPTHTLVEAHRVLKKDSGKLLISTPNALSYMALLQMLRGENFFPPYDGYSHYARHHRLFSTDELIHLLSKVGYGVHTCYSVYDTSYSHPRRLDPLIKLLMRRGMLKKRLDVIYLLATPHGEARYAYPDSRPYIIYQDVQGYRRIIRSTVRMADEESAQLVNGFHELEGWGGGLRWTGKEARLFLKHTNEQSLSLTFYSGLATRGDKVNGKVTIGDQGNVHEESHPFTVSSDTWQTITFPVPADAPAELLVTIRVDNPMIPAQLDKNSQDGRELGIAVREIALQK